MARKIGDPYLVSRALNAIGVRTARTSSSREAALVFLQEGLRVARESGGRWFMFDFLHGLGLFNWYLGRFPQAKAHYSEGLQLAVELGAQGYLPWFFGGFDWVALKEDRGRRAATLWGAANRAGNQGVPFDETRAPEMGLHVEEARVAWNKGFAMSLDEAVAYALSDKD